MFKILLIKPNICVRKGYYLQSKMAPPIGLAYLAGALEKNNYKVKIVDMVAESTSSWPFNDTHICYGMTDEELINVVNDFGPDLIGIGGFTSQNARIIEIVTVLKKYNHDIKIVLGGINATAMPRRVLENSKADYVIQGEGESGIIKLASMLENGDTNAIKEIDGIAYKEDKEIIVKPRIKFEPDLDNVAWPARHLLNHDKYLNDHVAMPVISSRSCPGLCTFCSVHMVSGKKWRARNPIDVVNEIEDLVTRWGYGTVSIFDDAANVLADRLICICKEIVNRKINVRLTFPGGLIIKYITKEVLYWMKQAGAVSLSLPVEHANEQMRNSVIKKNLKDDQIHQVLTWCKELKLLALVNMVIGMPGETEDTLKEIVTFVTKNANLIDSLSVYIATPYPGTEFYTDSIEKGYLKISKEDNFLDFDLYSAHIDTDLLSHDRIMEYKSIIEHAFANSKGPEFPVDYIRRAIRKPDEETLEFLEKVYFPKFKI